VRLALPLLALLSAAALWPAAPDPRLRLSVRDSRTGLALEASLDVMREGAAPLRWDLARGERRDLALTGPLRLRVTAPGHAPLEAAFEPTGELPLPVTFYLDPLSPPPESEPDPGSGRVSGTLSDASTGEPLEGVLVGFEGAGVGAATGRDGGFCLDFTPPTEAPGELPGRGTLVVSHPGYGELRVTDLLLTGGGQRLLLTLEAGGPPREEHLSHGLYAPAEEQALAQSAPHPDEAPPDASPRAAGPAPAALVVDPPDTVKVGMNCNCTTCTTVDVVSLETYVKRGLNDEWISSWSGHSLRAGAIAYRSYGAYYVLHPLNGTYDICSSTCCQVNDADTSTSTNAAVDATAGILLQRSNAVLRSEYSAENNAWDDPGDGLSCSNGDLSCGDGYAGSPSTSWPCLSDAPCATHGCYGHGRGMCQWGTSRWASTGGKLWSWIENHYYNDGGAGSGYRTATMTSPFSITSASPSPAALPPGSSFTITVQASNAAESAHTQVMIGAALYNASAGYVSDPADDAKVTLDAGANSPTRAFAVPPGTPAGTYDLIVALWLDTDGDSAITSADLSMTSLTVAGAVTVTGASGTCASPIAITAFPYTDSNTTSGKASALNGYSCAPASGSEAGPEVVYQVTVPGPGTLSVSVADGTGVDIDPHLLSACSASACLARADVSFAQYLAAGTYTVVCDTWTSPSGVQYPGAYSLTVDFTADTTPPAPATNLRWDRTGGQWTWNAVTTNQAGGGELVNHYEVRRASAPATVGGLLGSPTTPAWADASTPSLGCWYYAVRVVDVVALRDCESVVDNTGAAFVGTWTTGTTAAGRYGADYRFLATGGSGANTATWSFTAPETGGYDVALWYPQGANRSAASRFTVTHAGGASLVLVNQQANGGGWFSLGVFRLVAGQGYTVTLDDAEPAGYVVLADAVRWTKAP